METLFNFDSFVKEAQNTFVEILIMVGKDPLCLHKTQDVLEQLI